MSTNSWNVPGNLTVQKNLTVNGAAIQPPVSSDYSQTDTSQLSYIKNKPPITFDGANTVIASGTIFGGDVQVNGNSRLNGGISSNAAGGGAFSATGTNAAFSLTNTTGCSANYALSQTSNTYVNGAVPGDVSLRAVGGNLLLGATSSQNTNPNIAVKIDGNGNVTINGIITATSNSYFGAVFNSIGLSPAYALKDPSTQVTGALGLASSNGAYIAGSVPGDTCLRSCGGNLLIGATTSTTLNASLSMKIDPILNIVTIPATVVGTAGNGAFTASGINPSYLLPSNQGGFGYVTSTNAHMNGSTIGDTCVWNRGGNLLLGASASASAAANIGIRIDSSSNVYVQSGKFSVTNPGSTIAQPAWTPLTLVSGFSNYGGAGAPASYRQDSFGRVWIRGLVKGPAVNGTTQIFNVPAGLSPTLQHRWLNGAAAANSDVAVEYVIQAGASVAVVITLGTATLGDYYDISGSYVLN